MGDRILDGVGVGRDGGTTFSEYQGRRGVWAQGDCVFFEVGDAADACVQYRKAMTQAEIGITTHPPCVDGLRVRELRAEVDRLREALEVYANPENWEGLDPEDPYTGTLYAGHGRNMKELFLVRGDGWEVAAQALKGE